MSTTLLPVRPVGIVACATTTGNRRSELTNRRSSSSSSSSSNWWAPVFGWSTEPDYIDSDSNVKVGPGCDPKISLKAKATPGAFTEDKAKQLRKMMTETTAFHDALYHSSIAAKLASDFSSGR